MERLSEATKQRGRGFMGFRGRREDKAYTGALDDEMAGGQQAQQDEIAARHKHLGFNESEEGHEGGRFAQNPGHFGMAHHERREDTRTALSSGEDMSFEDHVKHFSHLVGTYPKDTKDGKAGDLMARVSVHLPEGVHHGTKMSRQEFEQHYNNGAVKVHAMPAFGHVDVDGHAANTIAHYGQRNHIPSSLKPPAEQTPGQDATGGEAATTGGGGSALDRFSAFGQSGTGSQAPTTPPLTQYSSSQPGSQVSGQAPLPKTKPIQGSMLKMLRKAMGIQTRRTRQYANR
jgi:hypothetical protein